MSLKLIHVAYLIFAAVVALILAAWAAAQWIATRDLSYVLLAVPALLAGPLLALQLLRFLKQVRGVGWL